jgi:hypothetical protein
MTYLGHVQNGVVVFDPPAPLKDGTPVRVEVADVTKESVPLSPEERVQQMRALFEQWNREDADITEEQHIAFHQALADNRGLRFQEGKLDDILR